MNRLMKWPLLCGLLGLAFVRPSVAALSVYQNDALVSYPGTETAPPVIDATNFINNNQFVINFQTLTVNTEFYETVDTLNYFNYGEMVVNTGFRFDTQSSGSGLRSMASSFDNSGSISCGSLVNSAIFFTGGGIFFSGAGQFDAWATNIVNSGTVDVGTDGLMKFTGQNVDLSRSVLTIEGSTANYAGSGTFGLNTNYWDPSLYLSAGSAISAFFPLTPFYVDLTNSTAFINVSTGASNNVIRAVFIQDTSGSSVNYNVYFDTAGVGFGGGNVTIEWIGSSLDSASGNSQNNYLYLNDNYLRGNATNLFLVNGVPDNFTFTESSTQLPTGVAPTAAGFLNVFPAGSITNRYSYGGINLTATTINTNDVANHSVTNLPGRVEISASKTLDLSLADITGMNYLSVQSPNQFNGSEGARILAPFSDINVGVTNGFLTVSNLMTANIPNWSGNIQAWSTDWKAVDANGVTNEYKVLIVGSQLTPTTAAQVQDLYLHGTNSIVISDALNVMRNFSADAQNLTLATNGPGVGATSLDGELNLGSSGIFWQSSVPNLRNLTNNGAIRTMNQANFGGPLTINATSTVPAIAAIGTLSRVSASVTNIVKNDRVTIGTNRYAFVNKLTNSVPNQVKVGTTFNGSMSNLIAAINQGPGSGTVYSSSTHANPFVTAGVLSNHAFTVTAILTGALGNTNNTLVTSTNVTWNGHNTLYGGADAVIGSTNIVSFPYDNFINSGLVSDQAGFIYANNFVSSGMFTNGIGSFVLRSVTATLTNGALYAGGDVAITADSLETSNLVLQAGRSLTLQVTNALTDDGVTNGNVFSVGLTGTTTGLVLPFKPAVCDLLGTTITNYAPGNKLMLNTWSGVDRGYSTAGYSNNAAIGRLVLDCLAGTTPNTYGVLKFSGTGTNNAIYVDELVLRDYASYTNRNGAMLPGLLFNTNLVIYYAQALLDDGTTVAEKINHMNSDHLRWMPNYIGYFSSTNLVYPAGVTNTFNAALAASTEIDSDGDGTPNLSDSTPFFTPELLNFTISVTNNPAPKSAQIIWQTIPNATNYVYYKTNLLQDWQPFTNYSGFYYGSNVKVTNSAHVNWFMSPLAYPSNPPVSDLRTNVWVFDAITNTPHFYRVQVSPWLTYPN